VALGPGGFHVESHAVVADDHLDLVALLLDRDPDVRRVRVLECVHHGLASVVVQQQRDRSRHVDLVDVGVELDVVPRNVHQEAPDRLPQACTTERRSVQLSDQGANPVRGSVLRLLDLKE